MTSSRRPAGEPSPDLARGLGMLLVSSAQLGAVAAQVAAVADQPDLERLDAARTQWCEIAVDLLDLRDRVEASAAAKVFTGSAGEHLAIEGRGGIVIPADAGYLTVLSKRMDRHTRAGRMFALSLAQSQP
jgi:hypothetical protein